MDSLKLKKNWPPATPMRTGTKLHIALCSNSPHAMSRAYKSSFPSVFVNNVIVSENMTLWTL